MLFEQSAENAHVGSETSCPLCFSMSPASIGTSRRCNSARYRAGRNTVVHYRCPSRRGGRVAEGGGLLNRYTVKSCIGGSNPPLSARAILFARKNIPSRRSDRKR